MPPRWQQLWREAVRDPRELLSLLGLEGLAGNLSEAATAPAVNGYFPLRVPRGFIARMRRGDPHDPLLRQVLPLDDEDRIVPGFGLDAVGDGAALAGSGVIRKYRGRALLVATGSCAIHCRYCFRRHFPYAEETAAAGGWNDAVALIADDATIDEVILSGGDPLSLATSKLSELTDALIVVPHLRRLRIHTRLPVVLPERVDAALLAWLRALPWPVTVVIHANHANEFDPTVDAALVQLRDAGATLLNQAVLLRGVNDTVDALADLSERGFAAGVLPYYLHQLDHVAGAAHFEIDDMRARTLHAALAARLSGYLVPRLVREVAGDPGKRAL
ncbi:MAG TPA: EF-P beta-lysylation protein EpmB [Luteimonas sp.]|nr:EF-P beta-lysylation protein EpmB [Luteimonas sp.]